MTKRKWKKPELVVLVRGKPGETVLAGCKGSGGLTGGYTNSNSGCYYWRMGCRDCSTIGTS